MGSRFIVFPRSASRMALLLCIGLIAPLLAPLAAQQAGAPAVEEPLLDYYDGLRAWDIGEKTIAAGIWLRAAQRGDERAMARTGQLFAQGEQFPQDDALAFFWLSAAVKAGHRDAEVDAQKIGSKLNSEIAASLVERVQRWKPELGERAAAMAKPRSYSVEDLVQAVSAGDAGAVRDIVRSGVTANSVGADNTPVLLIAVASGNVEIVQALFAAQLERKARAPWVIEVDPDTAGPQGGVRPLHIAAMRGDRAMLEALLKLGARAAFETSDGVTPAQVAGRKGFAELKQRLDDAAGAYLRDFDEFLIRHNYIRRDNIKDRLLRRQAIKMAQIGLSLEPTGVFNELVAGLDRKIDRIKYSYVYRYRADGSSWVGSYGGVFSSASDARSEAGRYCAEKSKGASCTTDIVPQGGCIAVAFAPGTPIFVSGPKLEAMEAVQEAIDLCRAESAEGCKEDRRVCGTW
jgi:hypothetical protein